MKNEGSSFAVFKARAIIEALELDDGSVVAAPVSDPPTRYCLAHKCGSHVEVVGQFETQEAAIAACDDLVAQLGRMAASIESGSVDLSRIVKAAGTKPH